MEEENLNTKTIILLTIVLFIVSCSRTYPIQKDFDNKMKEIQTGNIHTFDSIGLWGTFTKDISKDSTFSKGMKKITYRINNIKVKENIAIINVFIKAPDFSSEMHESQEFVAKKISEHNSLSPEENQKITIEALRRFKNIILKKLEYNHFNYIERTITVKYVNDGKNWKMDNDENKDFFNIITLNMFIN